MQLCCFFFSRGHLLKCLQSAKRAVERPVFSEGRRCPNFFGPIVYRIPSCENAFRQLAGVEFQKGCLIKLLPHGGRAVTAKVVTEVSHKNYHPREGFEAGI